MSNLEQSAERFLVDFELCGHVAMGYGNEQNGH